MELEFYYKTKHAHKIKESEKENLKAIDNKNFSEFIEEAEKRASTMGRLGGIIGAGLGGTAGYHSDDEHKLRNSLIGAVAGAGLGGLAGHSLRSKIEAQKIKNIGAAQAPRVKPPSINELLTQTEDHNQRLKNLMDRTDSILNDPEAIRIRQEADNILGNKAQTLNNPFMKNANTLKDTAIMFAKRNPKTVEGAVAGGILGAGSELAMPSRVDVTGQPVTNLAEMGKRGLLGAALGGVGGALKSNVSKRISDLPMPKMAQEDFSKIAGKLDNIKNFAQKNSDMLLGGGLLGSYGALSGYTKKEYTDNALEVTPTPEQQKKNAIVGGLGGLGAGLLAGKLIQSAIPKPVAGKIISNKAVIKKDPSPLLGEMNKGKVINFPVGQKAKSSPIPKNDKTPPGTIVPFPEKTAFFNPTNLLGSVSKIPALQKSQLAGKAIQGIGGIAGNLGANGIMNTAGKYMAKNPRVGGAVLGAGAGLVGNTLSGSDHALGSTIAGAGLGALGGRSLLAGAVKKNPLLGKNFAQGAKNEMASIRAAKAPTTITASSLQTAPPLQELINSSGVKIPQQTIPNLRQGLSTPQKPQEINWG